MSSKSLTVAPRHYLQHIDSKSFADCLTFIKQQCAALGVEVKGNGSDEIGSLLYSWAAYLSAESEASTKVFKGAVEVLNAGNNPHDTYNKLQSLHNILQGRKSFLDSIKSLLGANKIPELAAIIESHPFYQQFQKDALTDGFYYVQEAYKAFKSIDDKVQAADVDMAAIQSKLEQLQEYDLSLNSLYIPDDITNNLEAAQAVSETRELLKQKPELFYTPTAAGLLADASAKELYMLWRQSVIALDLAMSRWCCIAYFGLLLNAAVKHVTSAQAFAHMIAANNDQLKQFGGLLADIASKK